MTIQEPLSTFEAWQDAYTQAYDAWHAAYLAHHAALEAFGFAPSQEHADTLRETSNAKLAAYKMWADTLIDRIVNIVGGRQLADVLNMQALEEIETLKMQVATLQRKRKPFEGERGE